MVGVGLARGPVRRFGVGMGVSAVLLALPTACGGSDPDSGGLARALSFRYERIGGYGQMDQVLTITSGATVPVTIKARLRALDEDGKPVPGVTVSSVFGTEQGRQVLMPGANLDVMVFEGRAAAEVRGVDVGAVSAVRVEEVGVARRPVTARVVNASGLDVATRFAGGGIEVENTSDVDLQVQVVAIIWNRPGQGESQQALRVLRVGEPLSVPAHASVSVRPSSSVAAAIEKFGTTNAESVRAYVTR